MTSKSEAVEVLRESAKELRALLAEMDPPRKPATGGRKMDADQLRHTLGNLESALASLSSTSRLASPKSVGTEDEQPESAEVVGELIEDGAETEEGSHYLHSFVSPRKLPEGTKLYTAPPRPEASEGDPVWSRAKPTHPGVYGVRGFNLDRDPEDQFEAIVSVRLVDGELLCNLHESTSEDDFERWSRVVEDNCDSFEWCEFVPGAAPQQASAPDATAEGVEWIMELADEYDTKGKHERAHDLRALAHSLAGQQQGGES